jgi:hypothetical protein
MFHSAEAKGWSLVVYLRTSFPSVLNNVCLSTGDVKNPSITRFQVRAFFICGFGAVASRALTCFRAPQAPNRPRPRLLKRRNPLSEPFRKSCSCSSPKPAAKLWLLIREAHTESLEFGHLQDFVRINKSLLSTKAERDLGLGPKGAGENASRRVRSDTCRCAHRFDDWSEEVSNRKTVTETRRTSRREIPLGFACARSYRTLRDVSCEPFDALSLAHARGRFARQFVPGYDRCCSSGTPR